jgi:hypothetical protein
MPPNVIPASRDELEARRDQVLASVHASSVDDLRARSDSRGLIGDEWEALTELEEIEFLLGA